jgi:hypothetical protein
MLPDLLYYPRVCTCILLNAKILPGRYMVFTTLGRLMASGNKAILYLDKKTILNAWERDGTLGYTREKMRREGQEP